MLDVIPDRFRGLEGSLSEMDLYFAMCRGYQKDNLDVTAMEMTKWFNTNYHYIVPEFSKNQQFKIRNKKIIDEFLECKQSGIKEPKPVLIGPISYLMLGKEKDGGFHRIELADRILDVYIEILIELSDNGCQYLQLDEPFLITDLDDEVKEAYKKVYARIAQMVPELKVILTTYFDDLGDNLSLAAKLPVHTLHVDLVRGNNQLEEVVNIIPHGRNLSLGLVDGRNIWKNNFESSLKSIDFAIKKLGRENVWIAPSCSFLHTPYDLELETNEESLPLEIKAWMAFAKQKLNELTMLKELKSLKENVYNEAFTELVMNAKLHAGRKISKIVNNPEVKTKVENLQKKEIQRDSHFDERIEKQNAKYGFGIFPTTTIGSFPQTKEVRVKRRDFRKGIITKQEYESFIKSEIKKAVKWQEEIGLDVLVHGEFERNDMVEYFGEQLDGFAFTENGWVQSYGSRGVKPPVIYGDVSRKTPMTVKWSEYAQSLTDKKMKGMLTGPVTILQWSFVRNDQSRMLTTFQIAAALRDEVLDLEEAGIDIIQIDEPALREGLPLKRRNWKEYLTWAIKAFRICSLGVKDETQIHTHMCYSEFNDIITAIADMDADVISIETSRSQMELLEVFSDFKYPNQIGPGVYDIHSPRIPTVDEMERLLIKASELIPVKNLWVNPDCGLKTRHWEEVKPALENMVEAAKALSNKKVLNNHTVL
jgi:5-methyltetrahydropteroyltriglutamate--homocysteine methyltransferase